MTRLLEIPWRELLVREFSDPNDPKYVFRGIGQFASHPPKIVTSENYDEGYGVRSDWASAPEFFGEEDVHIYIFSISMINSRERRMKNPRETIIGGVSYFEYLARIKKLVVFMDEAHRYRAANSSQAIEDLKPILGIELTATPQVEVGGRSEPFKNVIYGYSLAQALRDGYVKEPWVAGRENFKRAEHDEESLEKCKLEDGIRIHEATKVHLKNYCYNVGRPFVKPFVLVIASSIAHANYLELLVKGDTFFEGRYRDKVRVVCSSVKPDEEERMVRDLLEIESFANPIEIVIHVNMLKEGWDVVNLYTIVPLRAANSKTLIEQSLGRGLRLPFGERTGKTEVDRLTIVSHDRFDDIVSEAKRPDSLIQKSYIIGTSDLPLGGIKSVETKPKIIEEIATYGEASRLVAQKTLEIIEQTGIRDPIRLGEIVAESLGEQTEKENVGLLVAKVLGRYEALSIRIPRIQVMPEIVKSGKYRSFSLDTKSISLQCTPTGIIIQHLQDGRQEKIIAERSIFLKEPPENFLAGLLVHEEDSVSENEENIEVAKNLSQQMISHLRSYLKTEEEVRTIVCENGTMLAQFILAQMKMHYEAPVEQFTANLGRDFTFLKSVYHTLPQGSSAIPYSQPPAQKSSISKILFTDFKKSTYPIVQFDSDSERVFSCILGQDSSVLKWVKTPAKSLRLYYQKDFRYEPDFIIETASGLFMCEVKSSAELNDLIVIQKKEAAMHWCEAATQHAYKHLAKPWAYVLIPHTEISLTTTFEYLVDRFKIKNQAASIYLLQAKGVTAHGILKNGRFIVLRGSGVCKAETNSVQSCYKELRNSLCEGGIISNQSGDLRFAQDYVFASPSTASSVILGASSNGLDLWMNPSGQTLKEEKTER